ARVAARRASARSDKERRGATRDACCSSSLFFVPIRSLVTKKPPRLLLFAPYCSRARRRRARTKKGPFFLPRTATSLPKCAPREFEESPSRRGGFLFRTPAVSG